jgi:peptidoglycan/xylan/chitin deacetylase (PgdA/CDA1 family)
MQELPRYYSSLAPFRESFLNRRPVLTYHHVGSRPVGTRIKGLFVSSRLFARQMEEFSAEKFATPTYANVLANPGRPQSEVVITFDDGFVDVLENALPVLREHKYSSIQFLVADLLGKTNEWQQRAGDVSQPLMNHSQIREWLAADQEIGAHTLTHPWLTRIPLAAAKEEITASKKKLEDWFGRPIDHFCYPYGDWNPAVRDLVQEAGYKTACTTERGLNESGQDAFTLKRITVRYPSRNWKSLLSWFKRRFG